MFLAGIFTGFALGIFVMCLMSVAGRADSKADSIGYIAPKNPKPPSRWPLD